MALSGSFSASQRNGSETVRCDWTGTQDITNNKTTITAKLYFTNQYALNIGSRTHTITINGTKKTITSAAITSAGEHLIGTVSVDVPHNADGSKTVSMAFVFSLQATLSGTYYESISKSTTATLNTIPRASQPTVSASSVNFGSNITISTNRASSSFTHELYYSINGTAMVLIPGAKSVGASFTWTVPEGTMVNIPNDTSATITVTAWTYKGTALIGTKSVSFTAKVPSSVKPTISTITCTDPTGYLSTFSGYVQSKSTLKIAVAAEGAKTSTGIVTSIIKSYKIVANGNTYTSNNSTTGKLKTSGANTISVTVTDSRGRTATKTTTISVLAYAVPTISRLSVIRCNSAGTADEDGSYMKVTVAASITALNDKNGKSFVLKYKKDSATSYTTYQTYTSSYTYSRDAIISIGKDDIYNVVVEATDSFSTSTYQVDMGTAYTLLDFNKDGKGIAFGKASTQDGFDVDMATLFRQDVTTEKGNQLDSKIQKVTSNSTGVTKELATASWSSSIATFTIPSGVADGTVLLYAEAQFPSGQYRKILEIRKNGTRVARSEYNFPNSSAVQTLNICTFDTCKAGDVYTAVLYQTSGSQKSITGCMFKEALLFKY